MRNLNLILSKITQSVDSKFIKLIFILFIIFFWFAPKNKKAIHLIKKIYPIELQLIKYNEQLGAKLRKKILKYYQISLEINLNPTKEKN